MKSSGVQIDSTFEGLRRVVARPLAFYTGVVCVATLLAFAGRWSWFCDLLVNFRTHYALLLLVAFTAAGVLRCWRVAGVAAVGLALNLWPMHGAFAGSQPPPVAGARSVRLVSFNVHVANGDMARVAAYLESLQADIVVFQEMTRANADRVAELLPRLSHRYPAGDPVAPDVLMLSRWPLVAPQLATREGLVLGVRADVDLGDRRLRLYGAHLYWPVVPESARVRNAQLAALGRELAECRGPCVVVGDFNVTPWSSHYRDLLEEFRRSGLRARAGLVADLESGIARYDGHPHRPLPHRRRDRSRGRTRRRKPRLRSLCHDQRFNSGNSQGLAPHNGNRRRSGADRVTKSAFALTTLEVFRRQLVPRQQLVEVRAVALGEACRLADVAAGDLQDLRKIAARKLITRLVERG